MSLIFDYFEQLFVGITEFCCSERTLRLEWTLLRNWLRKDWRLSVTIARTML